MSRSTRGTTATSTAVRRSCTTAAAPTSTPPHPLRRRTLTLTFPSITPGSRPPQHAAHANYDVPAVCRDRRQQRRRRRLPSNGRTASSPRSGPLPRTTDCCSSSESSRSCPGRWSPIASASSTAASSRCPCCKCATLGSRVSRDGTREEVQEVDAGEGNGRREPPPTIFFFHAYISCLDTIPKKVGSSSRCRSGSSGKYRCLVTPPPSPPWQPPPLKRIGKCITTPALLLLSHRPASTGPRPPPPVRLVLGMVPPRNRER